MKKQFSLVVELFGREFILNRENRKRENETKYGKNSPEYTERLKLIDDMNEMCDLIKMS